VHEKERRKLLRRRTRKKPKRGKRAGEGVEGFNLHSSLLYNT